MLPYKYYKKRGDLNVTINANGGKVTYNPTDEVTEIDLPVNQWWGM